MILCLQSPFQLLRMKYIQFQTHLRTISLWLLQNHERGEVGELKLAFFFAPRCVFLVKSCLEQPEKARQLSLLQKDSVKALPSKLIGCVNSRGNFATVNIFECGLTFNTRVCKQKFLLKWLFWNTFDYFIFVSILQISCLRHFYILTALSSRIFKFSVKNFRKSLKILAILF